MEYLGIFVTPLASYLVTAVMGLVVGCLTMRIREYKRQAHTIDQVALMTCRMVIYSDSFDVDEKIDAYLLYRSKGGNHRTKEVMSDSVGMDIDEYIINHRKLGEIQ